MDCTRCEELLSAMLDGEATPFEEAAARAHLEWCVACRRYQDGLCHDRALLRSWRPPTGGRAVVPKSIGWVAAVALAFAVGLHAGVRLASPRHKAETSSASRGFVEPRPAASPSHIPEAGYVVYPESRVVAMTAVLSDPEPVAGRKGARHE